MAAWTPLGAAGLLSSIGLGFLLQVKYLLPLTALFLAIAVGALLHGAKRRRGYKPFALGLAAAITILAAKFGFHSEAAMYTALAALVIASFWHSWPKGWLRRIFRRRKTTEVQSCRTSAR